MCSICGGNIGKELVQKASNALTHRGPDGSGIFADEYMLLAHNRLSIIDLSDEASQPMFDGDLVLVYNGEIYNYIEIRGELQSRGVVFRTSSDSEVLLKAYREWGADALLKFNGDFAFCIYDKKTKKLFMARDRLGNKPFYYKLSDGKLFFASEIKAFKAICSLEFDEQTLCDSILFNINDYSEATIYKGIKHLPSAHYAVFDAKSGKLALKRYWKLDGCKEPNKKFDEKEFERACDGFEELLNDALLLRLRSDVEVGILLSGGIDSSLLAALLAKNNKNMRYFGAVFPSYPSNDESKYMDIVAKLFGLNLVKLSPHIDELKELMDDFLLTQSDMTRSFSTFVQYAVFKELSKYSKVAVTGQGADELFGGYYHHAARFLTRNKQNLRDRVSLYGDAAEGEYALGVKCALAKEAKKSLIIDDNKKSLAKIRELFPHYDPNYDLLLEKFVPSPQKALYLDTVKFNLPMLLRFEDRNAMRFGVENRTPFTDYRIVEFAHSLPNGYKFHNGYSKFLLRKILARYIGDDIAFRKDKKGFEAPDIAWMRELGRDAEDTVDVRIFFYERLKKLI
ncbi:MAG: asparagine synthase (glutamine-hydrolyzing) [Campylobacterales bacterium]